MIKRALLLAGSLLAVLALLWLVLWREAAGEAPSIAPSARVADVEEEPPDRLEAESSSERAELTPSANEEKREALVAARRYRESKITEPAIKTSPVTLIVTFAGSGRPIGPSLADLVYISPERAPQADDTSREVGTPSPKTRRMGPKGEGRFVLDVPVGARLQRTIVCGPTEMLDGPRTQQNAASRFAPLYAPLDLIVGEEALEIRLEAQPGSDISGVVRDARSLRPIVGAKLSVQTAVGRSLRLSSDHDGRFLFGDPGAQARMRVEQVGYCPLVLALAPEVVALLDPVLHVAGRIIDARGAPVSQVRLGLFVKRIEREGPGRSASETLWVRTVEQGNFRFEGVPPCEEAVLLTDQDPSQKVGRLVPRREIGPLHADLEGLVLECPDSRLISVRVAQPDGTLVGPRWFSLVCEGPRLTDFVVPNDFERDYYLRVPVGVELHLVAIARARPEDQNHMLVGRSRVVAVASKDELQEVRITLSEPLDFQPPASGAQVIRIANHPVQATLDLRLLDTSGSPLPSDTGVELVVHASEVVILHPSDGWIRLRGVPGTHPLRLQLGEETEAFDLTMPWKGYDRLERQLKFGR